MQSAGRISRALLLLAASLVAACATEVQPSEQPATDAATTFDGTARAPDATSTEDGRAITEDGPRGDALNQSDVGAMGDAADVTVGSDAPGDMPADATDDTPPVDPCEGPGLIDLNAVGVTTGSSTRLAGSNALAPPRSVLPVPAQCAARDARQVVYRYTARTNSRLRVTVDGQLTMFHGAVWLLDRCAPAATSLGCDDRGSTAGSLFPQLVRVTTEAPVAAGATVFVVVAGYDGARGTFTLTLDELEPVAVGGACPFNDDVDVCAAGASCFAATPTASAGRCVAEGSENGACRWAGGAAACDAELECVPARRGVDRCVRRLSAGDTCDRSGSAVRCAAGTRCDGATGRCVTEGASLAPCRGTSNPCDDGLVCDAIGQCGAVVPRGGACVSYRQLCAAGTTCEELGRLDARCTIVGTADAPCGDRAGGVACGPGYACSVWGYCRVPAALDAACDPAQVRDACVAGSTCVGPATSGGPTAARCVRHGALAGSCEETNDSRPCDEGLACLLLHCVPAIAVGGTCTREMRDRQCATGSSCVAGRCVTVGTPGGACRSTATNACDPGLACGYEGCILETPLGASCDRGSNAFACAGDGRCMETAGTTRCVARGALDGECRGGANTCDPGLVCAGDRCRRPVSVGESCVGAPCAEGTSCEGGRCTSAGVAGGRCRTGAGVASCDGDLACSDAGYCLVGLPAGSICDAFGRANACAAGTTCQIQEPRRQGALGRCVAPGTAGGACRVPGAACDPGLTCARTIVGPASTLVYYTPGPRCLPAVADGAACDPAEQRDACVSPSRCVTAGPASWCQPARYTESLLPGVTRLDACRGDGVRVPLSTDPSDRGYAERPVVIPFAFRLFGEPQARVWPNLVGSVVFGGLQLGPFSLPNPGGFASALPGVVTPRAPTVLCARTVGAAPSRRLVLEWLAPSSAAADAPLVGQFEVVLAEGTETVDFLYGPDDAAGAVLVRDVFTNVGMQNDGGTDFVVHPGGIAAGTGLRFTPR